MGLSRSAPRPSQALFQSIVLGAAVILIDHITLLMTFETRENFRANPLQFEVVDFETAYNAFLRRSALIKFMMIPHYAYLVLKMSGPHDVISVR
jgi:hypothetical protein